MALLNVQLLQNQTTTINSGNATNGDTVNLGLVSSATLIVDGVDVNITSFAGVTGITSTSFQVINGADLTVDAQLAAIGAGSTFNYNVGAGSSLTINAAAVSVDVLQTTTVDFLGSTGTGHFTYIPPTLNLSLSSTPSIVNASAGDQVTVTGAGSVTQAGNVITFHGGPLNLLTLATYTIPAGATYTFNNANDTITFVTPCFVRGTMIATPEGEVPVEYLKEGDLILSLNNGTVAVTWTGSRRLDPKAMDKPRDELPVRIRAGAIAENVPHRDLFVSPDHCMFIDGSLIPAKLLINGTTITQEIILSPIDYFHVELEEHDVIWAEGAQAETYLDLGNRNVFLEPGVLQFTSVKAKEAKACYPLAYWGPAVDSARALLAEREVALGYNTDEAKAS
ncbi:Hint domain-containing protein [Phyllobacterium meliloti]|uniref:Hint domain-containing protein n=1 Tax=Phyllobacterium meliloti TaxID=555317 RepID=UPI000DDEA792|nr:Hint domain-containing protein [Phyllobacterium sp. T1293]UGX88647.1 Hint domain-containing protein [Phyllobacterium sp. T1293]